jgi:hypothetical protein
MVEGNAEAPPSAVPSGASPAESRANDLAVQLLVQRAEELGASLASWAATFRIADGVNADARLTNDARQAVSFTGDDANGPAAVRTADASADVVGDTVIPEMIRPNAEDSWESLPGLPGKMLGLLADFPLNPMPLEFAAQSAVDEAARLFHETRQAPWPFWVSLLSAAAAAFEIARREMSRNAQEQLAAPDGGGPTVA